MAKRHEQQRQETRESTLIPADLQILARRGKTWWGRPLPYAAELPSGQEIEQYPSGPTTRKIVAWDDRDPSGPWWTLARFAELREWIDAIRHDLAALVQGGIHLAALAELRIRAKVYAQALMRIKEGAAGPLTGFTRQDSKPLDGRAATERDRLLERLQSLRVRLPIPLECDAAGRAINLPITEGVADLVRGLQRSDRCLRLVGESGCLDSLACRQFLALLPPTIADASASDREMVAARAFGVDDDVMKH
jgi:hypothetical protein